MTQGGDTLPEGTDTILDEDGLDEAIGNSNRIEDDMADLNEESQASKPTGGNNPGGGANSAGGASAAEGLSGLFSGKFDELRGQATDRAFAFAQTGKDRATDAIDGIARMVEDAAGEIDAKVGTQYGDYARRAAQMIGGYSDAFKGKEIDELFADAKALAQKAPAVTIGAATALGFVVARLMKASMPSGADGESTNGGGTNGDDKA